MLTPVRERETNTALHSEPEPTWEIAHPFPYQGTWSEEEYMELRPNRHLEFSDGVLEILPMPKQSHQFLVAYLYRALLAFVEAGRLGTVMFAPLRVRLWPRAYREPDVVFMRAGHDARRGEEFWEGADLVMEVVSPDAQSRERDLERKRDEYARAGIPEYWIVDPLDERIIVLRLEGNRYHVHGEFGRGQQAASALLDGFVADVSAALDAGKA